MSTCKNCKDNEQIPDQVKDDFAYVCMNRTIGSLIAIVIVCICLLFASNAAWVYAWMQYDYTSEETIYQQDGKGTNIIGDSNEVDNYGAESDKSEAQTNP